MALDTYELAWAAGLFDGEGHASARNNGRGRKDGHRHLRFELSVTRAGYECPEVLRRFQRAVAGIGKIQGPYPHGRAKPNWAWVARTIADAEAVVDSIWPWLSGPKREQIDAACVRFYEAQEQRVRGAALCQRGHDAWVIASNGRRTCRRCATERQRERRATAAA